MKSSVQANVVAPTKTSRPAKKREFAECRPLEEFEGEDRELFLRAFFHFGAALMADFKTGNSAVDKETEDGFGESFQLKWIMQRSLFAAYEAMDILGIKPKAFAIAEFNDKLNLTQ